MKLATAQDMRKIDELAVKEQGLAVSQLMEAAGAAVVMAMEETWKDLSEKAVGILCGKGNNGGDGLAVARLLKQKKASVVVILMGEEEDLSPEARNQYQKAKAAKVPILPLLDGEGMKAARAALEECDLLVDALFGTGLSHPVEGISRELIQVAKGLGKPVVAVDIPSGLSADSGSPLGEALPALMTVTL